MGNNKLVGISVGVCVGVLVGLVAYSIITTVAKKVNLPLRGIDSSAVVIATSQVTNSLVICGTGGPLVVATNTARTSFIASGAGSSTVYLCRAASCAPAFGIGAAGSIKITPTSTAGIYEQSDGYVGPYSCGTVSGSSSINVSESK